MAYHEFFNSIKFRVKIITILPRSEEYNCQMHELMFQAGVRGMSERSKLIPCHYTNVTGVRVGGHQKPFDPN